MHKKKKLEKHSSLTGLLRLHSQRLVSASHSGPTVFKSSKFWLLLFHSERWQIHRSLHCYLSTHGFIWRQTEVWRLGESVKAAVLNQGRQGSKVRSFEGSSCTLKRQLVCESVVSLVWILPPELQQTYVKFMHLCSRTFSSCPASNSEWYICFWHICLLSDNCYSIISDVVEVI